MEHVRRAPEECVPRILHMIWLGCEPPEYFFANKKKWESLMPSWQVRCWHDTDGVDGRVAERVRIAKTGAQKADILRYTAALTKPCTGRGSAITAGVQQAVKRAAQTKGVGDVTVLFTDGALLDDPKRAALGAAVKGFLGAKDTRLLFVAGLSPEAGAGGVSVRDSFVKALGGSSADKRVLLAGAYDLSNVYPTFAAQVKAARR